MDELTTRLVSCFQAVFPALTEAEAKEASQASVAAWDSVAAITLLNVIEEEFGIQADFERLPQLDSFSRVHEYLKEECQVS